MLIRILLLALTLGQATALMGSPNSISYTGRITDKQGTPTPGPIDLTIKFFNAKTAGNQLGTTKSFTDVPVINGVFQVEITLNDGDRHGVFGSSSEVWVEVSTAGIVYPRQTYQAVPYALKVPISDSLKYDSKGNLTVDTSTVDLSKNESQVKFTDGVGGASVTLKASGTNDLTWTMPPNNGVANQVLKTDGSGNLAWAVDATAGVGTIDSLAVTNDSIANIDINSGANIDASKLGTGVVSNTEFNYLNGVTSGIQGQIDDKVSKSGDSGADLELGTNSTHKLSLETDGNPRLTILANGSVGIGMTNPGQALSVAGNIAATDGWVSGADFTTHPGGSGERFGRNSTAGFSGTAIGNGASAANYSIAIGRNTSAGQYEFVAASGLDVYHRINDVYFGLGTEHADAATNGSYTIHGTAGLGTDVGGADVVVAAGQGTGTAAGGFVSFETAPAGGASNSTKNAHVERLRIASDGNVGIGTTVPYGKLQISENKSVTNEEAPWNSTGLNLHNGDLTDGNYSALRFETLDNVGQTLTSAAIVAKVLDHADGQMDSKLFFGTTKNEFYSSKMVIDEDGNVGIGTTAPGVPLDVAGDIRSSNGNVDYEVRKLLATSVNNDDFYVLLAEKNTAQVRIQGEIIGLRNPSASAANIGKISVLFTSDSLGTGFGGHVTTNAAQEAGGYIGASLVEIDYSGNTYVAVKGTRIDGSNVSWDSNIEFRGIALNGDLTVVDAASTGNEQPFSGTEGVTSYMQTRVGVGTTAPNSSLQVNGSLATKLVVQSSDYTLTENDQLVTANAGAGNVVITLPTAVGIPGRTYTVKRTDGSGNSLTLATTGGQTIDGSATKTMLQYQYYTVVSDGAGWNIIGSNAAASGSPSGTITGSCTFGGGSTGTATCVFNSGMSCAAGNTARVFNLCNPGGTCTWNSSNTWPIGICVKD